ncbi:MAG: DUF455 family protein [Actinomycetota bacterium]
MSGGPLLRIDTATVLRRYWHLERALILTCGGWIPAVSRLESKAALAEAAWQMSLTGDELRERVFELRYPERVLEREPDSALIEVFEAAINAPDANSLLRSLSEIFLPALQTSYRSYLALSDPIADGPTYRFLQLAASEKAAQGAVLAEAASTEAASARGETWLEAIQARMRELGGVSVDSAPPPVGPMPEAGVPFALAEQPARDDRYFPCSFYWPDNFDPSFPYGEGPRLRLRTAISHLNEVWAVETAGAILHGLGPSLGWEFIVDAARWCYDESRHMRMGQLRLARWGFEPKELPLGSYIYESSAGHGVVHRLAMLAFFETKNIGKKAQRAETFGAIGDVSSQRDMEFDWADEAIHAGYGRRWLREALALQEPEREWRSLLTECENSVAARVARASEEEKAALIRQAERLIAKAENTLKKEGHD